MLAKTKDIALGLLIAFWVVLTPVHTIMYVLGALVFADLVTGIAKAVRTKTPVSSRRMRDTIGKTIAYMVCVLAAFGLDHLVEPGSLLCTRAVAVLIGLTEIKSVDENLQDITGFSIWQTLVDKLKPSSQK